MTCRLGQVRLHFFFDGDVRDFRIGQQLVELRARHRERDGGHAVTVDRAAARLGNGSEHFGLCFPTGTVFQAPGLAPILSSCGELSRRQRYPWTEAALLACLVRLTLLI